MPSSSGPCVIQVTNISSAVTKDQLNAFFAFLGNIAAIQLYPEGEDARFATKVAYIKFNDPESVDIALHLQNTVFNDRALFIQPFSSSEGQFPTEKEALAVASPQGAVFGILPKTKSWPARVVNQVVGQTPNQSIVTIDPKLLDLGLAPYPALTYEITDTSRIEDIRRTVYVSNLDPTITCDRLISFFNQAGEVKCARMTVFGPDGLRGCFIEFCDQESVAGALTYNGCMFGERTIRISHAIQAIERPSGGDYSAGRPTQDDRSSSSSSGTTADTVEDGIRRIRDAQAQINRGVEEELTSPRQQQQQQGAGPGKPNAAAAVIAPVKRAPTPGGTPPSKSRRSRSGSRSRHRTEKHDRHKSRRSRSRSKSRSRSHGRHRSSGRRSKRTKSRSTSRDRRKDRKRSKSRDRRDRSRDKEKSRSKKERRSSRDRSGSRSRRKKDDRKERKSSRKRSRTRSRSRDKKTSKKRSRSPSKTSDSRKEGQSNARQVKIDYEEQERERVEAMAVDVKGGQPQPQPQDNREEVPMDTSTTSSSTDDSAK